MTRASAHADGEPPAADLETDASATAAPATDPPETDAPESAARARDEARDEARLLVQSPRRLFFYWSFARDPRPALDAALGDAAARFRKAVRLVEAAGEWEGEPAELADERGGEEGFWFDAQPGRAYRAEVGFHAAGLPFVRLLTSNAVETPAGGVSDRADDAPEFQIDEQDFARVLAGSGFHLSGRATSSAAQAAQGSSYGIVGPHGSSSDMAGTRGTAFDIVGASSDASTSRGGAPADLSLDVSSSSPSSRGAAPARGDEVF